MPEAGPCSIPVRRSNSFSVTELEAAAGCPFRFFLKRGLGHPRRRRRRARQGRLARPLTRGSELHDLYARCCAAAATDSAGSTAKKDGAWLQQAARRLGWHELQREMPPATAEILDRETRDFLADVELFLEAECDGVTNTAPIGFEVSFGRPLGRRGSEPLARAEPVVIDLGGGLTFRIAGRIDRIDQVGASVVRGPRLQDRRLLARRLEGYVQRRPAAAACALRPGGGRAAAARSYKKPKVTGASLYYFSSHKGRQERVPIPAPSLDADRGGARAICAR